MDQDFKLKHTASVTPVYPVFSLLGQQALFSVINAISDAVTTSKDVLETILADMVGEVSFAAAIAEINAAIAALATDLTATIAASAASVVTAIAPIIGFLTTWSSSITSLPTLLTSIDQDTDSIKLKLDTTNLRLFAIAADGGQTVLLLSDIFASLQKLQSCVYYDVNNRPYIRSAPFPTTV